MPTSERPRDIATLTFSVLSIFALMAAAFWVLRPFIPAAVWATMIVILAMGIGLFAPPFGVGYYAACAIGRVDPNEGIRPIWGYLLALMVGLIIVAIFPWISIGFL